MKTSKMNMYSIRQALIVLLSGASLVTAALSEPRDESTPNTTDSSVFISPQGNFGFALNVPNDSDSDLYFSIAFSAGLTYGAVGLGASNMKQGALVLMAYPSASADNVTISPRRTSGHAEPAFDPDVKIRVLSGTGLVDNSTWVFNGLCSNCRSWTNPSGEQDGIDVLRTAQAMIYGVGPSGQLRSDDPEESVLIHYSYGSFTMDLVHATGPAGIPVISTNASLTSSGATIDSSKTGKADVTAKLHAVLMILVFFGAWPFGILVLRLLNSPKWHAINQSVAVLLMALGAILGFTISKSYTRSASFNTAHQVIGILVFLAGLVQFGLGYSHHRTFKKTQQTTKLAPIHVWLGRGVIVLGVANAFTGFPLAKAPGYDYALLAILLVVFPAIAFLILGKKFIRKILRGGQNDQSNGYKMEPWRDGQQGEQHAAGGPPHVYGGGRFPDTSAQMYPPQVARDYV